MSPIEQLSVLTFVSYESGGLVLMVKARQIAVLYLGFCNITYSRNRTVTGRVKITKSFSKSTLIKID